MILSFLWLSMAQASYPLEVNKAFLISCVGAHEQMLQPCKCILKQMHSAIPYDTYQEIVQAKQPLTDKRISLITQRCIQKYAKQQ